ncbi:Uncharacterised protein [Mycobacteroides abscessus subsp. abscessus]|nr:Uncharacterised protein [Mycobacteroides abscessus subsp. abscessus]
MLAVPLPPPDSTTSGYSVPWTKNWIPAVSSRRESPTTSETAPSKDRMNSRPMILRLASGSVTPASSPRNVSDASTVTNVAPVAATKSCST